jgi:hypothetical protein
MKELLIKILDIFGLACWLEIITDKPRCTYYFGPFLTAKDAYEAQEGYIEDLKNEGTQGIKVTLKRCKPHNLTIFDERGEKEEFERIPTFSSQLL